MEERLIKDYIALFEHYVVQECKQNECNKILYCEEQACTLYYP